MSVRIDNTHANTTGISPANISTTLTLTPTLNPYHLITLVEAELELVVPVEEDPAPAVVTVPLALVVLLGELG